VSHDEAAVRRIANTNFKRLRSYLEKSGFGTQGENSKISSRLRRSNSLDSREPKLLVDLLELMTEQAEMVAPLAVSGLTSGWATIVGDEVADHVAIEHFDQNTGELLLQADSTAWATQIRMLTTQILARIDEEIGVGTVLTIAVVGPKSPSWKHGKRRVPGRGPRDTYG